jgi:hypothetical protein
MNVKDYNSERIMSMDATLSRAVGDAIRQTYAPIGRNDYKKLMDAIGRKDIPTTLTFWPKIERFVGWSDARRGFSTDERDKAVDAFYALLKPDDESVWLKVVEFLKGGGFFGFYLPVVPDGTEFQTVWQMMEAIRPANGEYSGPMVDIACKPFRSKDKLPTVMFLSVAKRPGHADVLEVKFHPLVTPKYNPLGSFSYWTSTKAHRKSEFVVEITNRMGTYDTVDMYVNHESYILDLPYYYYLPLLHENLIELAKYVGWPEIKNALDAAGYREYKATSKTNYKPRMYSLWTHGDVRDINVGVSDVKTRKTK